MLQLRYDNKYSLRRSNIDLISCTAISDSVRCGNAWIYSSGKSLTRYMSKYTLYKKSGNCVRGTGEGRVAPSPAVTKNLSSGYTWSVTRYALGHVNGSPRVQRTPVSAQGRACALRQFCGVHSRDEARRVSRRVGVPVGMTCSQALASTRPVAVALLTGIARYPEPSRCTLSHRALTENRNWRPC